MSAEQTRAQAVRRAELSAREREQRGVTAERDAYERAVAVEQDTYERANQIESRARGQARQIRLRAEAVARTTAVHLADLLDEVAGLHACLRRLEGSRVLRWRYAAGVTSVRDELQRRTSAVEWVAVALLDAGAVWRVGERPDPASAAGPTCQPDQASAEQEVAREIDAMSATPVSVSEALNRAFADFRPWAATVSGPAGQEPVTGLTPPMQDATARPPARTGSSSSTRCAARCR